MFGIKVSELADDLVRKIMATHNKESWGEYLAELIKDADWNMLKGIARVMHTMMLAYGRHISENPRYEYERILSEDELEVLETLYVEKVKDNIDCYNILSYPDARIPFFLLQCLDKEYTDKFLVNALRDPLNVLRYLAVSVIKWTGSSITYELKNEYLEHMDDIAVREAIVNSVENRSLFKLTEYEQEATAAYYLLKVKCIENEKPERATEKDIHDLIRSWKME